MSSHPPPEVVEPDPELSPEEAEQARKDYLLTRFWISARGFWGQRRPAGLAVLHRAADPDRRQCRLPIRHQCLESRDLRRHREARFRDRVLSDRGVLPARDRQRAARRGAGVRAHGHPAALARLADQFGGVALADQRPILSTQSRQRRPENPEYRIAEDLRIATDAPVDFIAGVTSAFLSAATFIVVLWTIGGALTVTFGGSTVTIPGFLVVAAVDLCRDRLGFDHGDRTPVRAGLRGQEPGRG